MSILTKINKIAKKLIKIMNAHKLPPRCALG